MRLHDVPDRFEVWEVPADGAAPCRVEGLYAHAGPDDGAAVAELRASAAARARGLGLKVYVVQLHPVCLSRVPPASGEEVARVGSSS